MDLTELLKAAPQLQSIATTIVAGVPLAEIVKRIVLPSADALGKRMADRVERCFVKTTKMIEDAGVTPQPVEDKLVIEILRGASVEENEDLHTMWAALLANAASPKGGVRAGFIATLKQMSADEAMLLSWIYDQSNRPTDDDGNFNPPISYASLGTAYASLGFGSAGRSVGGNVTASTVDTFDLGACLNSLVAEQLIQPRYDVVNVPSDLPAHSLTHRGYQFVTACRPPKPKAAGTNSA